MVKRISCTVGSGDGYIGAPSSTIGGTQSAGYSFGEDEGTSGSTGIDKGGGGGGWYGGKLAGTEEYGGGGGSGYIGSSLLLSDKGMYMYSTGCTSSTAVATKTTCTTSTGHAVANAANTGNGYAKITYLGTSI